MIIVICPVLYNLVGVRVSVTPLPTRKPQVGDGCSVSTTPLLPSSPSKKREQTPSTWEHGLLRTYEDDEEDGAPSSREGSGERDHHEAE